GAQPGDPGPQLRLVRRPARLGERLGRHRRRGPRDHRRRPPPPRPLRRLTGRPEAHIGARRRAWRGEPRAEGAAGSNWNAFYWGRAAADRRGGRHTMRAAVLRNTGDETLDVSDGIEANEPGPGEVMIKIEATGVCHSDLSAMNGTIPQP